MDMGVMFRIQLKKKKKMLGTLGMWSYYNAQDKKGIVILVFKMSRVVKINFVFPCLSIDLKSTKRCMYALLVLHAVDDANVCVACCINTY